MYNEELLSNTNMQFILSNGIICNQYDYFYLSFFCFKLSSSVPILLTFDKQKYTHSDQHKVQNLYLYRLNITICWIRLSFYIQYKFKGFFFFIIESMPKFFN